VTTLVSLAALAILATLAALGIRATIRLGAQIDADRHRPPYQE